MADVQLTKIEYTQVGSVGQASTANSSNASTAIDFSQSSGVEDNFNSSNSTSTVNEPSTLRTEKELLEKFTPALKATGLNNLQKDELVKVLETATGKSFQELLNAEENEINKTVKLIEYVLRDTVEHAKKEGKTATAEDIIRTAQGYNIALNTGWSAQGFYNRQQHNTKGLSSKLAEFSPEIRAKGFANVSEEEQKRAIKAFFNEFFNQKEVNGKNHDFVAKLQLQTFGALLANSTDEERVMFKEVVKNMLSENVAESNKQVLESLVELSDKQAYAESWSLSDIEELKKADRFGNIVSDEDIKAITSSHARFRGKEKGLEFEGDLHTAYSKFIAENKDKLAEIEKLVSEGKELTPEQQELKSQYDLYVSIATGNTSGTAVNEVMSANDINEVLHIILTDMQENEAFYNTVMDNVRSYIEEHQSEFSKTPEAISEIIEKALNNEANNSSVQESTETEEKSSYNKETGLLNNAKSVDSNVARKEELQAQIKASESEEPEVIKKNKREQFSTFEAFLTSKDVTNKDKLAYILDDPEHAIREISKSTLKDNFFINAAHIAFKLMPEGSQIKTIDGIVTTMVSKFYNDMKASVLEKFTGVTFAAEKERQKILEEKEKVAGTCEA